MAGRPNKKAPLKHPSEQRLKEKIEATLGVETLFALTEFCKRTGCSLQDVAPVDLLKPLREPPIDENRKFTAEENDEFCEEVTDAHSRGLPLPARPIPEPPPLRLWDKKFRNKPSLVSEPPPPRQYGQRFKNRRDFKPNQEEEERGRLIRAARGSRKPVEPKQLLYVFRYRVLPADEIKTVAWFTRYWQSATSTFRKISQGKQVELLGIERRPISLTIASFPKPQYRLAHQKGYIRDEQFRMRYATLREFVRQEARLRAGNRPDLQDELEQRALMRLAAEESDSIEFLKARIRTTMESGLRTERRFWQNKSKRVIKRYSRKKK